MQRAAQRCTTCVVLLNPYLWWSVCRSLMHEPTVCRHRRRHPSGSDHVRSIPEAGDGCSDCAPTTVEDAAAMSSFERKFGFGVADLASWSSIVRLFNRPVDGSSLAAFRIMFGEEAYRWYYSSTKYSLRYELPNAFSRLGMILQVAEYM